MEDKITLLAGVLKPEARPWVPFDSRAVDFLAEISSRLRASGAHRKEELAAFGFWCRRAHIKELERRHASDFPRLGLGRVFHLAPSNVPTMFAYSLAIGLLAGNSNIVRLSTRRGGTGEALCTLLRALLEDPTWEALRQRISLVAYPRDDGITARYLSLCDGRVLWGGDETVSAMRALPMPLHARELAFPNRWSLALLSRRTVLGLTQEELDALARRFYNDTYLMDQNACSSPLLLLWLEDGGGEDPAPRFWTALAREAEERYPWNAFRAARKTERLYREVMTGAVAGRLYHYGGSLVQVVRLEGKLPCGDCLQGGFGLFFEGSVTGLQEVLPVLSHKAQTLICLGPDCADTARELTALGAPGICRVVPPGQALEMDTIWDGKDMIAGLSRMLYQ